MIKKKVAGYVIPNTFTNHFSTTYYVTAKSYIKVLLKGATKLFVKNTSFLLGL
jgi:hypothetical protein